MYDEKTVEDKINLFKDSYESFIKKVLISKGGIDPLITVLAYVKDKDTYGMITGEVPPEYLNKDDTSSIQSEEVVSSLVPQLLKRISSEGMIPICFSWTSEAWIRSLDKEDFEENGIPEDWKDMKKEEAVVITFESEHESQVSVKIINRIGKTVNEEGELIDTITLEDPPYINKDDPMFNMAGGKFANLFKKYKEDLDEEI